MSELKSYITLEQFINMLRELPKDTMTNFYIGQYLATLNNDPTKVTLTVQNKDWDHILLNKDSKLERSINELIDDLNKDALTNPHAAVLLPGKNNNRYCFIDPPKMTLNIKCNDLMMSETTLPDSISYKANEFVRLLNSLGIKSLKSAQVLVEEKYKFESYPTNYLIVLYGNTWYTYGHLKRLYPNHKFILVHYSDPIYNVKESDNSNSSTNKESDNSNSSTNKESVSSTNKESVSSTNKESNRSVNSTNKESNRSDNYTNKESDNSTNKKSDNSTNKESNRSDNSTNKESNRSDNSTNKEKSENVQNNNFTKKDLEDNKEQLFIVKKDGDKFIIIGNIDNRF